MAIMKFIKRLLRKRAGQFQVWDTSALSNHFELFKQTLKDEPNVTLVIPEGVSHEISVGRRNNDICREIYKFIEGNTRNPRLVVAVTDDSIRSWAVDEQVVHITQTYENMGYDVTMVSCDRDQSFKARLKKLNVNFLPVSKEKVAAYQEKAPLASKTEELPVIVPVGQTKEEETQIELPSRMVGNQCVLAFDKRVAVYDARGKRRISRPEGTVIAQSDMVYYNNVRYIIRKIGSRAVMCTAL